MRYSLASGGARRAHLAPPPTATCCRNVTSVVAFGCGGGQIVSPSRLHVDGQLAVEEVRSELAHDYYLVMSGGNRDACTECTGLRPQCWSAVDTLDKHACTRSVGS